MLNRRSLLLGAGAGAAALCLPALAQGRPPLKLAAFTPDQVRLHWRNSQGQNLGTLAALHGKLGNPAALMNAGIFEVGPNGYQPQGLHIEEGWEYRPLNTRSAPNANFYMKPNGVFYIDAEGAHIVRTLNYAPQNPVRLATQSGPLLFDAQGLHPRFIKGSSSRKRRNAVGIRGPHEVVFALADQPINFWDFAHVLKDAGCIAALYMDGVISDLWLKGDRHVNTWRAFASLLSANELSI